MRYPRLVALLLVIGSSTAAAQERAQAFDDVRFGSSPTAVLASMTARQLAPLPHSDTEDLLPLDQRFIGRVNGQNALVTAYYDASGHLEKMLVSFLTPDEECVPFYRQLRKELLTKYGTPALDAESWDFPYANGGQIGQEHIAIRVGKGVLATVWDHPDSGSTDGGITLRATDSVIVRLAYESSRWPAELERRQTLAGEDSDSESSHPTNGSKPSYGRRRGF